MIESKIRSGESHDEMELGSRPGGCLTMFGQPCLSLYVRSEERVSVLSN